MQVFDEAYFRKIFDRYYDRIYSGFLRKTASDAIAQDLTQITFIKFWEYRSSYSFQLSPEVQLLRKAKLIFIDWLRKEAHQRKLMQEMQQAPVFRVAAPRLELTDTLAHAISQLPPVRKKVFTLAYLEGYSHEEIAGKLHIAVKTVDAHIFKALKQLRKLLALYMILLFIS